MKGYGDAQSILNSVFYFKTIIPSLGPFHSLKFLCNFPPNSQVALAISATASTSEGRCGQGSERSHRAVSGLCHRPARRGSLKNRWSRRTVAIYTSALFAYPRIAYKNRVQRSSNESVSDNATPYCTTVLHTSSPSLTSSHLHTFSSTTTPSLHLRAMPYIPTLLTALLSASATWRSVFACHAGMARDVAQAVMDNAAEEGSGVDVMIEGSGVLIDNEDMVNTAVHGGKHSSIFSAHHNILFKLRK